MSRMKTSISPVGSLGFTSSGSRAFNLAIYADAVFGRAKLLGPRQRPGYPDRRATWVMPKWSRRSMKITPPWSAPAVHPARKADGLAHVLAGELGTGKWLRKGMHGPGPSRRVCVVQQVAAIERAGRVKSTPGGSPEGGIDPPSGDVPPAGNICDQEGRRGRQFGQASAAFSAPGRQGPMSREMNRRRPDVRPGGDHAGPVGIGAVIIIGPARRSGRMPPGISGSRRRWFVRPRRGRDLRSGWR